MHSFRCSLALIVAGLLLTSPLFAQESVRLLVVKAGKVGYLDNTGAEVIAPQYALGGRFSEGLAAVMLGDREPGKQWGFIDTQGNKVGLHSMA